MPKLKKPKEALFWADKIAKKILTRKKFRYLDKAIKPLKRFNVKTSASLSGVLHIGRLSDTIRAEAVFRALFDQRAKAGFIWVAEDMDPLRAIPTGVASSYADYIGMPVTDIPDPNGCHSSWAAHHLASYNVEQFVQTKLTKYSMREEYKKGTFKPYIKAIMANRDKIIQIQNKYRTTKLKPDWSPWIPICKGCGKIITPKVTGFEGGKVVYKCSDYKFAKSIAKGCGYEGVNDPLKGNGKLVWKSEWGAQWKRWKVVSEGGGKEYQVPGSAFWINAEICEKVLGWPAPEPIFYEHLIIEGQKMSASLGNVIYPKDWLKVASPELLRFYYNKKLMKTRSFSWSYLPRLYDEFDNYASVYFGKTKIANERERKHMCRLFAMSQFGKPEKVVRIPYDFAAMVNQLVKSNTSKALKLLQSTGHLHKKVSKADLAEIRARLTYAENWVEKYAPEHRIKLQEKVPDKIAKQLNNWQKKALLLLAKALERPLTEQELYNTFWEISKAVGLKTQDLFRAVYLVLLGQPIGPRLAPFITIIGRKRVEKLLKSIKEF